MEAYRKIMTRTSDYHKRFDAMARKHMSTGGTIATLADTLQVAQSTVYLWKKNNPSFSEAIDEGREATDDRVEARLLDCALGNVTTIEEKAVVVDGQVEVVEVKKGHAPSVVAAKYWLENRRSGKWKSKQQVEHTGELTLEQLIAGAGETPDDKEGGDDTRGSESDSSQ